MSANFFTDNADLQFHLAALDLGEVLQVLEDGYRYHSEYPGAPRSYADAVDGYTRILTVLGDLCATQIAPLAAAADLEGAQLQGGHVRYAAATQTGLELLCQAELMGAMLPWEYGGMNMPEVILQMMIEILSRADAGLMTIFGLQEISATIAEYGDDEMKARTLPRFSRGEVTGAMVLTEPDAGSDLGVVQTRATLDAATGQWHLSGVKRFITNGNADILLVLARSEEGSTDARGLSLFEVEADETVRVRRLENKLGIHASPTCEIQFDETPARLLGKRRFGLIRYSMAMMNGARIAVAAQALGIAEAAFREALGYARARIQFGRPIIEIPAVRRLLLSMRAEIEATRALVYQAGLWVDRKKAYERQQARASLSAPGRERLKQADRLAAVLTPMAKYHASEMANRVCYQAMQVHGGTGYMREFPVERMFRDVRVTSIYEGTSQLQVAAASGGLLGHALDALLADWAAEEYGPELAVLKARMGEATALLHEATDALKAQPDRDRIDYYAADLTDLAVSVVNGWLLLGFARSSEQKREMAEVYLAQAWPQIQAHAAAVRSADAAPLEATQLLMPAE